MKKTILSTVALLTAAFSIQAVYHEPYSKSRVYWDMSTKRISIPQGHYSRMIELPDGRLLMTAGNKKGIAAVYSSDGGDTWTTPRIFISNTDEYTFGSAEFLLLDDGTLLMTENSRPVRPFTHDRPYHVNVYRSSDFGETWSAPVRIFTQPTENFRGVWEPILIQLPSGEIQCYYSSEVPADNTQEIDMSRSFDNGLTWEPFERMCYRQGHRDGMPVPIITNNNDIVFTIEDNGQPGYSGFRATTIRTTLENNWHDGWVNATSSRREKCLTNADDLQYLSAGPYLRKLPGDETIVAWMGEDEENRGKGLAAYRMFTAIGDVDARNFTGKNPVFYVPTSGRATWVSLSFDSKGNIFGTADLWSSSNTHEGAGMIRGKVCKGFEAAYGTPTIDGYPKKDPYAYPSGRQLTMGSNTGNRFEMDFLYDENNLYFYLYAGDREILPDEPIDKDGVFLWLDVPGHCDTYPQKGIFKFFFNVNGEVTVRKGLDNKWQPEEVINDQIHTVTKAGKLYYLIEAAIPWSLLGEESAPTDGRVMRINVQQRDRREKKLLLEKIPDTTDKASWTWPEFRLLPNPDSGISTPADNLTTADDEAPVEYYNLQGQRLAAPVPGINIRRQGTKTEKIIVH